MKENQVRILVLIIGYVALVTGSGCGTDIPTASSGTNRNDDACKLNINLSGSLQNPAFSPDGNSIVFTRFRNGYNEGVSDLFIYNLQTGELKTLVSEGSSNVNLPGSVWNGTSNSIVFSSERDPHDEIYSIPDTGSTGDEFQLTSRQNKQSFEPSFSPDGQWIVFESHNIDVADDGVVTKYKIDGSSGYVNLTSANDNCKQPNWSPAGNRILYQRAAGGLWAIWTMDTDGGNNVMVTSSDANSTDAVFSFDGQWIIYSSENSSVEIANIYRIPSGGGTASRITNYSGYDGAPSISPDGSKIAFESTDVDPDESAGTAIWIIDIQ